MIDGSPPVRGIISAKRDGMTEEESLSAHQELLDLLLRNGFSPLSAEACHDGLPGTCWAVPGISESELVDLAIDFGQSVVLYQEGPVSRLIRL